MIIDCETFPSTLESISDLYKISENQIRKFMKEFDLDEYYVLNKPNEIGNDILFSEFEKRFGKPKQKLERICWFHLTSTTILKMDYFLFQTH